jgi:hypothetical protein
MRSKRLRRISDVSAVFLSLAASKKGARRINAPPHCQSPSGCHFTTRVRLRITSRLQ